MSADEDSGNFLARWSRLKRSDATKPDRLPEPASTVRPTVDTRDASTEPPVDITKLPKIEDLTPSSDIAAFLQKGVPEELKRLALRRIWSLDPAIRNFIEVAENQYDWNAVGGVPGFGEMTPGTDIAALLRQAIGQTPEPLVAECSTAELVDAAAGADNPAQSHAKIAASQQDKPAGDSADAPPDDARHDARVEGVEPPDTPPINTERLQPSPPANPTPRARHGGALPSFADDKLV